jgi:prepilin-type N-terminal cleavage/methylation domain-containing protein
MRRGFTLIELSTVIVVVGIIASLAAVNLSDQVQAARVRAESSSATEDLQEQYRLAREQMTALRIEASSPTGVGSVVKFIRVKSCAESTIASLDDPAADQMDGTVEQRYASADVTLLPSGWLCIEPDGVVVSSAAPAGGDRGDAPVAVQVDPVAIAVPLVLVRTRVKGGPESFTGLRLDRVGFSEVFRTTRGTTDEDLKSDLLARSGQDLEHRLRQLAGRVDGVRVPTASDGSTAGQDNNSHGGGDGQGGNTHGPDMLCTTGQSGCTPPPLPTE